MKWFFIFLVLSINAWATAPNNFPQAKKVAEQIFQQDRTTLYCGCQFKQNKAIDLETCHMKGAKGLPRSERMEWEHMMPASHFGQNLACWKEKLCVDNKGRAFKGRKCCEKMDKNFQRMEGELFNLWPANGLVNAGRSNYQYAQLYPVQNPNTHNYHGCPVVVDKVDALFEPSDESKGTVARAMLFMQERYHLEMNNDVYNLMVYWYRKYPPTAREKRWETKVAAVTGYHNPYITS